ncbi:TMAO reductase system sensor histidine kinase/response regulator TorS [Vibrio hepatarius]|uniref:TMAO reductase system sensor histidine kinase/response regulator TorS n=1 Tax=Vibrio hepatarius TaxID=171383 RepID=UPI001C09FB4F|nr:TMAO reductase system sensor histidine kinase/response regulator TorS [Vibrio hepatarius]MBU2895154.1 TMAO reductase system sensor histidine kinase/response regulator TorS [Vibrio hepatarius]
MLLEKASIGKKLLFAFVSMAMLVVISAAIGVIGFSSVAKTERQVVNSALPSMIEARQVSELSARIISSVQTLSNAKTEQERQQSGKILFTQLESLLSHTKQLGSDSFDSTLLVRLENDLQRVINTLAELGLVVEKKLYYEKKLSSITEVLRQQATELELLTGTQVSNTSANAVANITQIYNLLETNQAEKVYQALDTLVEVDLDRSERLHELHLLAFKVLNHIEETRTTSNIDRIYSIEKEFLYNLDIMQRRVKTVEDPTRLRQMADLLEQLEQGSIVFEFLAQRYQSEHSAQMLLRNTLIQFTDLNSTVAKLIDDSNKATSQSVEKLNKTLKYSQLSLVVITVVGMLIVAIILWKLVYISVIKRLAEYSSALLLIAKGHLNIDINVYGSDELANMGRAIVNARDTAKSLKVVAESETQAKRDLQQHKEHLEEIVTERTHQLENANERLNQEVVNHEKARSLAEQANRAKSTFLATMSHEIRTPLNGVLGTARLLKDTILTSKQSHFVEVINRSGSTLLAVLNDILDYSKIEAGFLEIRPTDFSIHEVIEEVKQLLESKALEKNIDIRTSIDGSVNMYLYGDVIRISQVLTNLVSNAVKFTEHGHIDICVVPDPLQPDNTLFVVTDTGIGIETGDQTALFDAFTQASGGIQSKGGTGLGLAISKRIVDAMGGTLQLESQIGKGSQFSFSIFLPNGKKMLPKQRISGEKHPARVLLVEDNPINSMVAEGFLESLGHQIDIAPDGSSAQRLYQQNSFDIALVDINLPDCNGVELLDVLKQLKGDAVTKMIAVSAHVYKEEVQSYLKAGFDGFLPKPLDKDSLAEIIENTMLGQTITQQNNHQLHSELSLDRVINSKIIEQDTLILGPKKMKEIIEIFDDTANSILRSLQDALDETNSKQIKALVHKLKGSAGSLGLNELYDICLSIEKSEHPTKAYKHVQSKLPTLIQQSIQALYQVVSQTTK